MQLAQHVRVAANRALAINDQAAGQYVGALDRDRDGCGHVAAAEVVVRAHADRLAGVHVHGVVRDFAAQLGAVVLEDGRRHRRFLALVDRARGHGNRGVHDVGVPGDARDRLADAFEVGDRGVELLANGRVCAGRVAGGLSAAGGRGGQRDCAADGQQLDEHLPALAGHLRPADDGVERHEHVLAACWPVLECDGQRVVPAAHLDARQVGGYQGGSDAVFILVADQVIRVVQLEGEAEHRRDRGQRDVALVPVQANAGDRLAFPFALADDAAVDDRSRVRAGLRRSQGKAGDFGARGQAGQVTLFLFLRTVVKQQFRRSQRVGDADRR